ncbi:unnamed protein product [Enterobius vermicularis]|uniref:Mitochondrial DNA polymerase catalytic subunit n=1 Tax=Enterobius vermicularis TaxID=51028 RepID=A0A158Q9W2_ENTVE|nr:unnamed protein product [Enterobius vermicularis]
MLNTLKPWTLWKGIALRRVEKNFLGISTRWTCLSTAQSAPSTSKEGSSVESILKKIDLVPLRLHKYLFGSAVVPENVVEDTFTSLELPQLEGDNLQEHFYKIGESQMAENRRLLEMAFQMPTVPKMPTRWELNVGWSKYDASTGTFSRIDFPDEEILFFDVEVCVRDGQLPTLAVALSPTSWYSWCSERLVNNTPVPSLYQLQHLISLESANGEDQVKIVIGHNVAYDRSRVREQYLREESKTRFWDTMSMAIPIFGMADHQVKLYEKNDVDDDEDQHTGWYDAWRRRVCRNSLVALHQKLCSSSSELMLDKSLQNFFVKEPIEEIRNNFQSLVRYCAADVIACMEVYKALFPEFIARFPHPTTWMGMIEMGSVYLPITDNWRKFYGNCQKRALKQNNSAAHGLIKSAKLLAEELSGNEKFKNDPFMWHADWKPGKNFLPCWYESLLKNKHFLDVPIENLKSEDVKLRSRVIPFIFGLCYAMYPLHYKLDKGFGFLIPKDGNTDEVALERSELLLRRGGTVEVPYKAIMKLIHDNMMEGFGDVLVKQPDCQLGPFDFFRLPHPRGAGLNVGDPLGKDFYIDIEEGLLHPTRFKDEFFALLSAKKATRFRDRIEEQVSVWLDDDFKEGALAPPVIPAGTVTRRAVHKLWLTAINAKDEGLIGTDLKSMVECPQGWCLVGADVDSQEQWIAAILGDSALGFGIAGATPFSNMLLAGSKSDHSDLHSVVAKQVNITRDKAKDIFKVLNYARLYGSGTVHAIDFLKQSGINESKAKQITQKLFETTKGRRDGQSPNGCSSVKTKSSFSSFTSKFENWLMKEVGEKLTDRNEIDLDRDVFAMRLYENYSDPVYLYSDGFESATFNYLELMLRKRHLRTPVLDCQLGYGLEPLPETAPDASYFLSKYRRSIVNWVVQSSAVDFLHLLLSCMKWLCSKYKINARFVISIHDEVRYMVKEEDRYRCALALMLSNMLVRAMISQKLGVNQLPLSVAFFSQVDVDYVLRKEVNLLCRTPDGEERPPGEALDIKAVLEKTGGSLTVK